MTENEDKEESIKEKIEGYLYLIILPSAFAFVLYCAWEYQWFGIDTAGTFIAIWARELFIVIFFIPIAFFVLFTEIKKLFKSNDKNK